MTPEQREDIRQAVAYHREHGGYAQHNVSGRSCRCAACRLVRTVEYLDQVQATVDALWAEVDGDSVKWLRAEQPEVIELATRIHQERHHQE